MLCIQINKVKSHADLQHLQILHACSLYVYLYTEKRNISPPTIPTIILIFGFFELPVSIRKHLATRQSKWFNGSTLENISHNIKPLLTSNHTTWIIATRFTRMWKSFTTIQVVSSETDKSQPNQNLVPIINEWDSKNKSKEIYWK